MRLANPSPTPFPAAARFRSPGRARRRRAARPVALACLFALALAGLLQAACEPSPEQVAADRDAIHRTLEEYASRLSQAYAFSDPSALEEVAMPREVASVESNIARLAADGRSIAAHQKEMVIEDLNVFQPGHAYVRTFETWDIRVTAVGAERVISSDPDQESRVRYRLKQDDDGAWKVLGRERLEQENGGGGGTASGGTASGGEGGGE